MRDFNTILLMASLRALVRQVSESPDLDQAHPEIVEFRSALEAETVRLEQRHCSKFSEGSTAVVHTS